MDFIKKRKKVLLPLTSIVLGLIVGLSFGLGFGLTSQNYNNKPNPIIIPQKTKQNFGLAAKAYFDNPDKWNLTYVDDVERAAFINLPNKDRVKNKANIMYQMNVYGFSDGDGDGIGDLWGAYKKLGYFDKLNIGSIWLSPISISPSYHGYDVMDYTSVSSDLGGMQAFDVFLREAHKKGIKIFLDMVFNHTSTRHPWFAKAANDVDGLTKYSSYYTFDKRFRRIASEAGYSNSIKRFFSTFNSSSLADLHLENENVLNELKNVIKFWVKKGVDGFRFDAFKHFLEPNETNKNNPKYQGGISEIFYEFKKAANEEASLIGRPKNEIQFFGEGLGVDRNAALSYANFTKNGETYPALDGVYDQKFWSWGKWTVLENDEPQQIKNYVDELKNEASRTSNTREIPWMPYLDNHDTDRWIVKVRKTLTNKDAIEKLNENDKSLLKSALLTLSMMPGRPIIYQGDELGYHSKKPDWKIREPLTWTNENEIDFQVENRNGSLSDRIHLNLSKDVGTVEDNLNDSNSVLNSLIEYLKIRSQNPWLSTESEVKSLKSISGISQRDGGIRINSKTHEKILFIGTNAYDIIGKNQAFTKYNLASYISNSSIKVLYKSKDVVFDKDKKIVTIPITGTFILKIQ